MHDFSLRYVTDVSTIRHQNTKKRVNEQEEVLKRPREVLKPMAISRKMLFSEHAAIPGR
jgi:hypothetical protein